MHREMQMLLAWCASRPPNRTPFCRSKHIAHSTSETVSMRFGHHWILSRRGWAISVWVDVGTVRERDMKMMYKCALFVKLNFLRKGVDESKSPY